MITDHEQITKKKRKKTFYIIKLLPNCSKKKLVQKPEYIKFMTTLEL